LRCSIDAAKAQQQMHEFDTSSSRRQMVQIEEEIVQLCDESSGLWSAFGARLNMMRDSARNAVEIQSAKCDSEMLKRECNVLRLLVESGWEMHQDSVAPSTPQMMSKTPVSLRLRTGSPNLKIPTRRLNFAGPTASEERSPEGVLHMDLVLTNNPGENSMMFPALFRVDNLVTKTEQAAKLVAVPVAEPVVVAAPVIAFTPVTEAVVPVVAAPKWTAPAPSDDVPADVRSFGSSLSMLQSALGNADGFSNVSLGSLSLDSSSSNTSLQTSIASSSAVPPVRSSVRERLQKMVRERVAAKKEEDANSPASSSSPRFENLAWSPVATVDNVSTNVSDLSIMMNDESKISLSFANHTSDPQLAADHGQALLAMRERKLESLKFDIKQLEAIATPGKSVSTPGKTKAARLIEEENAVNQVPSMIPRPGLRQRPARVLSVKK
jgi:hypothetical protein